MFSPLWKTSATHARRSEQEPAELNRISGTFVSPLAGHSSIKCNHDFETVEFKLTRRFSDHADAVPLVAQFSDHADAVPLVAQFGIGLYCQCFRGIRHIHL